MRALALLCLTVAAAACGQASGEIGTDPASVAEDAVRRQLKDPDSAKFEAVMQRPSGVVCGWVNARNGFGGYSGKSAFWYDPATGEAFVVDPTQNAFGKQYDAKLFREKGCPSGLEHMLP